MKRLEVRGHITCVSIYRGGRQWNRYRIVLKDEAVTEAIYQSGSDEPVSPDHSNRGDRMKHTGVPGTVHPVTPARIDRGTPEKTPERTHLGQGAPTDDLDDHRGPRASPDAVKEILRKAYGEKCVTETGHVHRSGAFDGKT